MKKKLVLSLIIIMLPMMFANGKNRRPIDLSATKETVNLFNNLDKISKNHTLFGHQHDTEYGHGNNKKPYFLLKTLVA